jgi:hypothetical protein
MAKISQLPAVPNPDGTEQVIVLKDGIAKRAIISALLGSTAALIKDQIAALVTSLKVAIGSDLSEVGQMSVGTVFAGGSLANNSRVYWSLPAPYGGALSAVTARINGGGTGVLVAEVPIGDGGYKVAYLKPVTASDGTNTWAITDSPTMPAGFRVGYKRLTGGSVFYQAGGAAPYVPASAINAVGDVLPDPVTDAVSIALAFTVTYAPAPITARIAGTETALDQVRTSIDAVLAAAYPNLSTVGNASAASAPANATRIWSTAQTGFFGKLETIRARTTSGGTARLSVHQVVGGNVVSLLRWDVVLTGGDTIDEFGDEQLGTHFLPPGCVIMFERGTCGALRYDGGGSALYLLAGADTAPGATNAYTAQAVTVSLSATIRYASVAAAARPADQQLTMETQRFAGAAPSPAWKMSDGWAWADGLQAVATGWDKRALYAAPSCLADRVVRAGLRLSSPADVVGIVFDPAQVEAFGAGAVLNGGTGKLELHAVDALGVATLAGTTDLPAQFLAAGATYTLEARRHRLTWSISVTNRATGASCSYARTFRQTSAAADRARMCGAPGVVCLAGTPTVIDWDYSAPVKGQPHTLIAADSNGEGSALGVNTTNGRFAWPYLFDDARGHGDVVIGARGGDETINFLARMPSDLSAWRPRHVIIALGTNDGSQTIWRSNMKTIIAATEAIGAQPWLTLLPPHDGAQDRNTLFNADLLGGYFGRYRLIDFAAALSVGGDRVTLNPDLYVGDGLHANIAGQLAMFAQLRRDAPELFDGARADAVPGPLVPGVWRPVTGINRLRLNGTGTVTIEARDAAGNPAAPPWSRTITNAVDLTRYAFFGAAAVAVCATTTGNAYAEIF